MKSKVKGLLILAAVVLLITACSGGGGFKKAASGSIGSAGGEIKTSKDELALIVPAGSLTADATIEIAMNKDVEAMGVDQASPVFEIKGLEKYSKPLTIRIKTTKPLGGDTYAVVGLKTKAPSGVEEGVGYDYIPCTVKGDTVEFTINPSDVISLGERFMRWVFSQSGEVYADQNAKIGPVISAAVITNQTTEKTEKFTIIADSDVKPVQAETVAAYMDFLYKHYTTMGFDLNKYEGWPLKVKIRGLYRGMEKNFFGGGEQDAGYFYKVPGMNPWIVINKELLGSFSNVQITLMHEFFHFVQGLYGSNNTWFSEATATWSEEYYTANSGLLPMNYSGHGESTLQIFSPLDLQGRSEAQHGYGSAALIKYLAGKQGQGKIVEIYKNIGNYNGAEDTLNAFAPIGSWINDFYLNLIQGKVYSQSTLSVFRIRQDAPKVSVDVIPAGDAEKTAETTADPIKQSFTIPPYGAKFVTVELKSADPAKVADSATLVATAGSDVVAVNLFRVKGKTTEVASGGKTASLGKVKTALTDKSVFLAMATNLSNTPVTVDVSFEVNTPPPLDQLVGEWTAGKVTYGNIYIHPELLKIATQDTPAPDPADKDNPFAGCDAEMGKAIAEAFAQLKKLEGTTAPSHLKIEQTGPEAGLVFLAIQQAGKEMSDYGDATPFSYKDGKLTASIEKSQEKGSSKVNIDMNAVYDKKTKEILLSGKISMEMWGEGVKALSFDLVTEYRKPIPEGAFAATLPQS